MAVTMISTMLRGIYILSTDYTDVYAIDKFLPSRLIILQVLSLFQVKPKIQWKYVLLVKTKRIINLDNCLSWLSWLSPHFSGIYVFILQLTCFKVIFSLYCFTSVVVWPTAIQITAPATSQRMLKVTTACST